MRSFLTIFAFIALTFFCWGIYGPVLHEGQRGMGEGGALSSLRPFICVGIAYFLIAVVVPVAWLQTRGEKGHWTMSGTVWSLLAGTAGALGALGIILAFKFRGSPVYVMPLVFGMAPVVNTFVTMFMARSFRDAASIFIAGIIIVAIGAAGLMFFKPTGKKVVAFQSTAGDQVTIVRLPEGRIMVTQEKPLGGGEKKTEWTAESLSELKSKPEFSAAYALYQKQPQPTFMQRWVLVPLSIALTALCWGSYGPVLHNGQMKMGGSRLRPLLCVGLAYFAIAVIVPVMLMPAFPEPGGWLNFGTVWSLAAGAAGAIGALGIIMAFTFGGKPIYVMPMVFGCAPVVNTFATILHENTWQHVPSMFFASLALVIAGAVTVLIFAPKGKHGAASGKATHGDSAKQERTAAPT